jgi:hypothetical protein
MPPREFMGQIAGVAAARPLVALAQKGSRMSLTDKERSTAVSSAGSTSPRRIRTSQKPAGARRVDRLVKRREDPRFSKLRAYAVPVEIRA